MDKQRTREELQSKVDYWTKKEASSRRSFETAKRELIEVIKERQLYEAELDQLYVEDMIASGNLNWDKLLEADPSKPLYDYQKKFFEENWGAHLPGTYWNDSNQTVINVMIGKNNKEDQARMLDMVKTVAPHMKPRKDENIWFGIFEYTLSAGGSYYLVVNPRLSWAAVNKGEQFFIINGSLNEVLYYISKYHWYNKD